MELKMEASKLERSGIRLLSSCPSTSSSSYTISSPTTPLSSRASGSSSDDNNGGRRRGPRWKRMISFHLNPNLVAVLIFSLLFSSRIFSSVEGNSEIESCVRLMHSGQNPNSDGASAMGHSGGGGSAGAEHFEVLCNIRKIHVNLDIENLTSFIPSGNNRGGMMDSTTITKLKIACNGILFFESQLSPGQFSGLSELRELEIDRCKLTHLNFDFLSGLRHLRRLTINTGNSEWAGHRSLEVSGTLEQMPQLHHISIISSGVWKFPEKFLCQDFTKLSSSIQTANYSYNLLTDIDDLGLPGGMVERSGFLSRISTSSPSGDSALTGDGCLGNLKILDLSHNSLRNIGSRRLERMVRLHELHLQNNMIGEFDDSAFTGLGQLKLLNLSSNRLIALPPTIFEPVKLIQNLNLMNNSLTVLSPGLFTGLEHLLILDLSMNNLESQWITSEVFKSLVRLVILSLASNKLTNIGPTTFNELYSVQSLDLSSNLISEILPETFSQMKNLHTLSISNNRISYVDGKMLSHLFILRSLYLNHNKIQKIHEAAFTNCTSLHDLQIANNRLENLPASIKSLGYLKTLDIGENLISQVSNTSFTGMNALYGLRMVDNKIESLPPGFCSSMKSLRVLNLSQNKIKQISSSAFTSCPEIRVLRLDTNSLQELPPTLAPQLPSLLWLNVSENQLRRVDYHLLPASIEWLDLSYNGIETLSTPTNVNTSTLGGVTAERSTSRLRVMDISYNKLKSLDQTGIPSTLEILKVNNNNLRTVAPHTFIQSSQLRRVELVGNQLENIPLSALRLPPIPVGRPLPEVTLGGNPFLCNCEMEWLSRINQLSALRQHPTVLDLDAIVCRLSYSRTVTHIPLPDIKPQDFLCPYKSHCFALCHCCEFDACDCEMSCPSNCTCYHDDTWSANVVNCANTGATAIPSRLPMDSTSVALDGNAITSLKSHTFIGRKNLRVLYLNSSLVQVIHNKSFNGLQSLQTLHLEKNLLKTLHGFEFDHLTRLRELYLQDNLIGSIANTTFLSLKSIEILRLDGNRLVTFQVWQLSLNPYLVEIGLARNEWNCDCQFLHQLYGWVTDNSRKVIDLRELQCVWNTTHKPGPHLIDYNRTCGSSWALIDGGLEFSPLPLIFGCISLVILLVIIIIAIILCRDNVRLFIFSRFGIRICTSDFDDDKFAHDANDAYLVYSQKDEEFVTQHVAEELESKDSYRLCLHYRDLISETGDLKEMMVGAVENSKSVVVILSRNFLQGEWASGEYRGAFHAVLKRSQKQNSVDMKKVVIVFIDDITPVDVAPDIRSWVRHNRIQVIKWSLNSPDQRKQRKFWTKLKYLLPAPSSHYHSNITSNTTTATSASSNESSSTGGIMATLKYSNNENEQHHIIVDEYNRTMTMNINNKLWPYGYGPNFVALPPKYQIPNSPGNHSQTGTIQSHLSLNNYNNQSIHSQSSPLHHQHQHHHYHPPPALPLSNPPPKSPPSSQSTDSTTTNGGDETTLSLHTPTSFSLMFQQMQQLQQQQHKSPVPVPKLYNSPNVNNSVLISSNSGGGGSNSNSSNHGGGESYLSLEGEHVYEHVSSLDPPSPQGHQTHHNNRLLNNIHLPNGYTYQPQMTVAPQQQQQHQAQWHPSSNNKSSTPKGTLTFGSAKNFKQTKDGNPVQTYLV